MERYFDEAICAHLAEQTLAQLDPAAKADLAQLTEEELIQLHFGLGMWIRNTYFYEPNKNWVSTSPGDDSMRVIEAIWRRVKKNDTKK